MPAQPGSPTSPALPDTVARARTHFDVGNGYYASGLYQEAIREFQAGHALVPRPSFLLNLGQAYRKVGNLDRAKESYVAYLRSLPADSPLRDQALRVLAELEVQLEERSAHSDEPGHPPEPIAARAAPPEIQQQAPPPVEPLRSRARWIGVGLAAAGVGLATAGVVLELRAKSLSDELSELDRKRGTFDWEKDRLGRRQEAIGAGLLVGGGVALVTGVGLYFLLGRTSSDAKPALALAPTFAPDGGFAFALKGRF